MVRGWQCHERTILPSVCTGRVLLALRVLCASHLHTPRRLKKKPTHPQAAIRLLLAFHRNVGKACVSTSSSPSPTAARWVRTSDLPNSSTQLAHVGRRALHYPSVRDDPSFQSGEKRKKKKREREREKEKKKERTPVVTSPRSGSITF